MRINAVRSPILAFAALTAVFVPLMTSTDAALGVSPGASASPSASSASDLASPPPPARHHHPHHRPTPKPTPTPSPTKTPTKTGKPAPTTAEKGAFYRSVLDLRPDMPGISDQQYYYIGQAFCTNADLGYDALNQVQQAYSMPAGTLAYDNSMATMMLETAPMEFIQENQDTFGFDGSDLDTTTLNAFRRKLCTDHGLWTSYARFVREQLETLGPWQNDPSFDGDPSQSSQLWGNDLATWRAALQPWLPAGFFGGS